MGVIVEPKLVVETIELEVNDNDEYGANSVINTFGPTMPVIKINDYVLSIGEVRSFNLKIGINKIPKFTMTVDDSQLQIRKALKKEVIDKSVIFIGYKDWYIKFNGIILNTPSSAGDSELYIDGSFYNAKLYDSIQKPYNEKSIQDVLKDICTLTDMGLYTIENNALTNVPEFNMNPDKKHIEYFDWVIQNYTNNLWSVDTFGFFHVSDISSLRKQSVDKFKIFDGVVQAEKDMIITTNVYYENDNKDKFVAEYFTINSNIGEVHKSNNKVYKVEGVGLQSSNKTISSVSPLGIGEESKNTFDRFLNSYFPFYKETINKDIGGKVINVSMRDLIYEITPFSIINLEIFLPKDDGETEQKLDTENSGNKIVINYEFDFNSKSEESEQPKIKQYIDLI